MLFQGSDDTHRPSFQPSFPSTNSEGQGDVRMLNLFQYEEEFHELYVMENKTKQLNNNQIMENCQSSKHSSSSSVPFLDKASFDLDIEKELGNNSANHYYFPANELQSNFLTNTNNSTKHSSNTSKSYIHKTVKHLSDDETYMHKETFTKVSNISSRKAEDSRKNFSLLDYTVKYQQSSNTNETNKSVNNNLEMVSKISVSQNPDITINKSASLLNISDNEYDSNSASCEEENGISLGMTFGSKTSTNLLQLSQNGSKLDTEDKFDKHKNNRISLVESRQHGKNNSGEFVGKKPSLMTVIEDEEDANGEAEEVFEYEEDFEEELENQNKDKDDEYTSCTKEPETLRNKFNIHFAQPSGTQHNLYIGMNHQMPLSSNSNRISISNYVKSYAGLNSKIIDLNPPDDEYEYDSNDNENDPISLAEASDINRASHQSGLCGSRTIEDLILDQKKAIAASSSAIIALAAASREGTDAENINSNLRSFKRSTNISLSELVPRERACFTVEDMMKLQNIHFSANKEKCLTNIHDKVVKPQKPKYSEEDMIKDQKISLKGKLFENLNNQEKKSEIIPDSNELSNLNIVNREINLVDTENIVSNIDEKKFDDTNNSSELDSSKLADKLNDKDSKANCDQLTTNYITSNLFDNTNISHPLHEECSKLQITNNKHSKICEEYGNRKIEKIIFFLLLILSLVIIHKYNQKGLI